MKSRKQRNRTPRAFKNNGTERGGWSGGNRKEGFSLHSGFMVKPKPAGEGKESATTPPEKSSPEDSAKEG